MREAPHGFAHPKREHGSRTPQARTVHLTTDRSQSGKNDLSATEGKREEAAMGRLDRKVALMSGGAWGQGAGEACGPQEAAGRGERGGPQPWHAY